MKSLFHIGKGRIKTLHELFLEQLKDLYSAETQLTEALPELAETAHAQELKNGFETHLEETMEHIRRIEHIFRDLGEGDPTGRTCKGMKGLIKEARETISENATPEVKDVALIAEAQRLEHYEIAGYSTVRTYAQLMGYEGAARLLQTTLDEENATDNQLSIAAETLNVAVPVGHEPAHA